LNILNEENPTLFFNIEKNNNINLNENFKIEVQILKLNSGIPVIENIYHYLRFDASYIKYFLLRPDKNKKYMIIEISFNNEFLDFSINYAITRSNTTSMIVKAEKEGGKTILTIKNPTDKEFLYLNIFKSNKDTIDSLPNNFVFKYINVQKVCFNQ